MSSHLFFLSFHHISSQSRIQGYVESALVTEKQVPLIRPVLSKSTAINLFGLPEVK